MAGDLKTQVAALIRASRTGRGLTQEDLADRANLSVQSISALENAKYLPALDTLVNLVEILGLDIADVISTSHVPEHRLIQETKAKLLFHRLDDDLLLVAVRQLEALVEHAERTGKSRKKT
ncbi:helix-turn-helix transcriptional regulator [Azospirillum sp. RWY-5-1]|uniref:Helix-turn-helix transcriptional regulator n=1 Tax=Azospirillum oleiclasticum TaxID=2735135 RepID=A0ABX2T4K1_9PROT|nr:helix-turn-helix transcriptional regulator [Azospirillum oleiclasticum]NYZ11614.1 helix-turn-helix transcriptional regulator [Azospirillum oleiclasticum]NYZ18775.1 helix-turn-helix transcriptional regulator [Azospirillum oleiclasticum]